jgi:hypothetical protein
MTTIFKYEPISFLIGQGKDDEVIKFLTLIYRTPTASSEKDKKEIFERFIKIERSKVLTGQNQVTLKQAITSPDYARASWTCFGLNCFNQLTAIGPVNIFATSLLKTLNVETGGQFPVSPRTGAYIIGLTNLVFATLSVFPINRFGRRTILFYGQVFMTVAHILIGVFKVAELYVTCFIFILVFIAVFQLSQGSLSFIYVAEVTIDASVGLVMAG